jgi:Ca2+-binding RTX toxin-like protein
MNASSYTGLGGLLFMALFCNSVFACPGVFSGEPCDGGSGPDNCTRTADDKVDCDFSATSPTQGVTAYFTSPSSTSFLAYGKDGDNEDFCCPFSALDDGCSGTHIDVVIQATDLDDALYLTDTVSGTAMDCSDTVVYADAGNDTVYGSDNTTNSDFLYGEEDTDTIRGLEGDDTIEGGDGTNYLYGNDGNDSINGDLGDDWIKGGAGPDVLSGNGGDDHLCGEAGNDTLSGIDGDDVLEGNAGTDTNNGGLDYDECEWEGQLGCEYSLTVDAPCSW